MSFRFMRMILFFDLPMETSASVREYNRFRKFLIKNGFQMLQKSVYIKLAITKAKADATIDQIKLNTPTKGNIEVLIITEKQFSAMITLLGDFESSIIDDYERLIEL